MQKRQSRMPQVSPLFVTWVLELEGSPRLARPLYFSLSTLHSFPQAITSE